MIILPPNSRADHFARDELGAKKCSFEIDPHRRIPNILVQIHYRDEIASVARGRVVDQNVDVTEALTPSRTIFSTCTPSETSAMTESARRPNALISFATLSSPRQPDEGPE